MNILRIPYAIYMGIKSDPSAVLLYVVGVVAVICIVIVLEIAVGGYERGGV